VLPAVHAILDGTTNTIGRMVFVWTQRQVRGDEESPGEQVHDEGADLRRQDAERRVQVEEVRAEVHQEQTLPQVPRFSETFLLI
jgi:hypothetical protein